jgi:uncharacterized membrane protein YeaQ/YmgE (transglycosylase-associated protein family)
MHLSRQHNASSSCQPHLPTDWEQGTVRDFGLAQREWGIKMSLGNTYKELYEFELSRKGDLTSALSLPTGVVSVVIGALVFMARELHPPFGWLEQIQLGLIGIAAAACVFVIGNLCNSLYNFAYGYLPTPGHLKDYRDQLSAFHVGQGRSPIDAAAQAEIETLEYIDEQYVVNADRNLANNDVKSAALHNAHTSLIVSIVFTMLAGGFFVANSMLSAKETQKFELVNLKELTANGIRATAPTPTASTSQPAAQQGDKGGPKPATAASSATIPPKVTVSK